MCVCKGEIREEEIRLIKKRKGRGSACDWQGFAAVSPRERGKLERKEIGRVHVPGTALHSSFQSELNHYHMVEEKSSNSHKIIQAHK